MQHGAAEQLHVEVPHAERALGRLAHRGERLGQEIVERLALLEPLAELGRLAAELVVGERGVVVLERVDVAHHAFQAAQGLALARPQNLVQEVGHRLPTVAGAQEIRTVPRRPLNPPEMRYVRTGSIRP